MSKTIPVYIGTVLLIGATILAAVKQGQVKSQEKLINQQEKEMTYLEQSLETEIIERKTLETHKLVLEKKIIALRDSIKSLKIDIKSLGRKVKKQRKAIKSMNAKLKKLNSKYFKMKKEIAALKSQDGVDKNRLAALIKEKDELRNTVWQLKKDKNAASATQAMTQQELMDLQASELRLKRINSIINNTKVKFHRVTSQKDRYTNKVLTKIKKDGKKWKYTAIQFSLINNEARLLLDENFIVKIVDTDTDEVLSYIETNPNFPNSSKDSKGIEFAFDGEKIDLAYYNNKEKTGKNYAAKIYYVDTQGNEHLLSNGTKAFIINKKLVAYKKKKK